MLKQGGESMGPLKKLFTPSCLSFGLVTALRQWPHLKNMIPSTRLVSEPKGLLNMV